MPNTVNRSRRRCYIEFICCLLLLLLFVPINIFPNDEEKQFLTYITTFNKSYNSSDYYKRLEAFKRSLSNINLLNSYKTNDTAKYGLTKFSDMLPGEFLEQNTSSDLQSQLQRILLPENFDTNLVDEDGTDRIKKMVGKSIPQKVDWREQNAVTKIRSQGPCNACWAFAATGMIESVNAINSGRLESLSIQKIIDCSPFDGCDGGNICALLGWMKAARFKIDKENDYPLTLTTGKCRNVSEKGLYINDFVCKNFVGSEEEILYTLAFNGPVAVAINALSWQHYIGGTIQFHCDASPSKLGHAVEIVGYDLTKDVPYYIVRNSWGEDFGDNGYMYIAIGKNMCGLATEVTIVQL